VVVGTHGTLKNLVSKRILLFRAIRILVFDEADEMLKARHSGFSYPPTPLPPSQHALQASSRRSNLPVEKDQK
jgi:hypothetical protein